MMAKMLKMTLNFIKTRVSASDSIQLISNVFWICLHITEYCDKGYVNRSLPFIFIMVIITVTKHFDKL